MKEIHSSCKQWCFPHFAWWNRTFPTYKFKFSVRFVSLWSTLWSLVFTHRKRKKRSKKTISHCFFLFCCTFCNTPTHIRVNNTFRFGVCVPLQLAHTEWCQRNRFMLVIFAGSSIFNIFMIFSLCQINRAKKKITKNSDKSFSYVNGCRMLNTSNFFRKYILCTVILILIIFECLVLVTCKLKGNNCGSFRLIIR